MEILPGPGSEDPGQLSVQNEVHLWQVLPTPMSLSELVKKYEAWLSDEEKARCARFVFEDLRRDYFVSRILVRKVLSFYSTIRPQEWKFIRNTHGRPEIENPLTSPLYFNLSHTKGAMICAVTSYPEMGVDIESLDRKTDIETVAERVFSGEELESWKKLSLENKRERFFVLWTLKEAYIKARGMGFNIPLDGLSFHLDSRGIQFKLSIPDDPNQWKFELFRIADLHQGAVAVRLEKTASLKIIFRQVAI